MTTNPLEQRLREKIVTGTPRPGFETRIQAMAREPDVPEKRSLMRRCAVPALAIVAVGAVLSHKGKSPGHPGVSSPDPVDPPKEQTTTTTQAESPVQREIDGLKNDAKWTMGLFQKALPSLPLKKKKEEEK